jgi:SNF2 family DNA or RNA helicase
MEQFKGSFLAHQETAIRWMCGREAAGDPNGGILADEPGMGKTVMTIGLMLSRPCKTLIVCPKSVATQWVEEISRFCDIPAMLLTKKSDPRPQELDIPGARVVVTSYGTFQRIKEAPWVLNEPWGRVVCDEGHVIRNRRTQIFKGISRTNAESRFCLTGTPIQNKETELRTLAEWVGFEGTNPREICEHIVLRRTIEDVPDFHLPELGIEVHPVQFDPEERALYDAVEEYARGQARQGLVEGNSMQVLEAILRCRQICSHPQLFIEGMRKKFSVDIEDKIDESLIASDWLAESTKVAALCDLVRGQPAEDKAIVFCSFVKEMHKCREALATRGVEALTFHGAMGDEERAAVLAAFKEDSGPRVLLVQILCGGTGLNLQQANHVYVMSPQYNPTWEVQALGRSFRHGQTKKVRFVRLVMGDSIEENICEVSERKLSLISTALGDPRIMTKLGKQVDGLSRKDVRTIFKRRQS